jgi:hypothetical protein
MELLDLVKGYNVLGQAEGEGGLGTLQTSTDKLTLRLEDYAAHRTFMKQLYGKNGLIYETILCERTISKAV